MYNLDEIKKKTITLNELYLFIANGDVNQSVKYKVLEYDKFYDKIMELIKNNKLKPYGKETNQRPVKPLSLKYKIIKEELTLDNSELIWITRLNKKINTNYYKKNVDEFRKHKVYIESISNFLNQIEGKEVDYVSVNERSYEIFNDEKFIKGSDKNLSIKGSYILEKLKLSLSDIYCYNNYQPLLTLTMPGFFKKESKNILIVENLDTYWTINRIMFNEPETFKEQIDMLVYGEGNAIVGRFNNYETYNISSKDNILYFGDIDNHGFYLYHQFKNKYKELNIKLAIDWYEALFNTVVINNLGKVRTEKQQQLSEDILREHLKGMKSEVLSEMLEILKSNRYIPQESLNYSKLKKFLNNKGVING